MTATDVGVVVVLHHPDPALLRRQHAALASQVDRVVYVDNGGGSVAADLGTVLPEPGNVGLARGLDDGLDALAGCAYVLLLDQDSVPAEGMVACLRAGFEPGVAAVGPAIEDVLTGRREPYARLRLLRSEHLTDAPGYLDVDLLITSGALLSAEALAAVGPMDERLFLDWVDVEWCFRAAALGWRLRGTFATSLEHRRGQGSARVLGRPVRTYPPGRSRTIHRDRARLWRRAYVPVAWKAHDAARVLVSLALHATVLPDRRAHLAAALGGLREGLR